MANCDVSNVPGRPVTRSLFCRAGTPPTLPSRCPANESECIPGRFRPGDGEKEFWVPIHKRFDGDECLTDVPGIQVVLSHGHINEKLRRIHRALHILGHPTGVVDLGADMDILRSPAQWTWKQAEARIRVLDTREYRDRDWFPIAFHRLYDLVSRDQQRR